ncbi:hypothetical protein B0A49_12399 [Cryomyces minteri]|uniref:Fe2OG dioxygenase domain-containing protein n=1 Tax=Cryomyces minteri TaxID=331657 RepID=A0A4U0W9Z4_9PEZI|nr:hypothetical protein B0A49_11366 [Cryomyces minteri]TKA60826.1 hypothetical protein B0A49_12399 [Cryomyces minteri]
MTFSNPTHGQDSFFNSIYNEVRWQKMYHVQGEVPRLVCVQGEISPDGSMPVYRHPSDQSLPLLHYSSSVEQIREEVQKIVHHPINHVLIQLYRSGNDYISEHSDKTLDIVRGSSIVNVSFGAQRTMRLRTKKSADPGLGARQTHRVPMPHNSMFVLGPETNMRWLHGINADRRRLEERSEVELAYEGMRISLTFRHIGTFLNADESLIWGQGATGKSREVAAGTVSGDDAKTDAMINAFGTENHSSDFDWNATYGAGFDVLHFRAPPPILPIFFLSGDLVEDTSVLMYLEELGIRHERKHPPPPPTDPGHKIHPLAPAATQADQLAGQSSAEEVQTPKPSPKQRTVERRCCLRDTDPQHTEVASAVPILLYLDRYHSPASASTSRPAAATAFSLLTTDLPRLTASSHLASHRLPLPTASPSPLQDLLAQLNDDAARRGTAFLAGEEVGVADCAFWPLLDALGRRRAGEGEEDGAGFGTRCWWLEAWWERMRGRESVRRAVGDGRGGGGKVRVEGA